MNVRIRRYRSSDRAAVRRLIIDVWGKRWLPGVASDFETSKAFVAENGGKIVAGMTLEPGTFSCLIDELIVKSSCRRQRVGSTLLKFAIARAKRMDMRFVKVFVDISNRPALYEKFGFRAFGEIRNAFERGDHYLYLCKFL